MFLLVSSSFSAINFLFKVWIQLILQTTFIIFIYHNCIKVEMAIRIEQPYFHFLVQNFLQQEKYDHLVSVYNKLQFMQKQSDLFHFFQTNQLSDEPQLQFFKEQLNRQMGQLVDLKDTFYNIFASYYFKGDYLLCHDDVIEDRKFAFSYYLEDHQSADLVLYDNTATKIEKQYKVRKNLLVIFQVSNISYHEVAFSKQNGRKAVTGWLNIKGFGGTRNTKSISTFIPNIPKDLFLFKLQQNLEQEEYYHFPEIEYNFEAQSTEIEGPFYERKLSKLQLEQNVVFQLQGYTLLSADYYRFNKGDYILLNDRINNIEDATNLLDVFIVQLPQNVKNSENYCVSIVGESGEVAGLPYVNNSVFIVHRNKKNYFVDRVKKEFLLGHLIYTKNSEKSKKVSKQVKNKSHVKSIRQKLIQHLNNQRDQSQRKQIPLGLEKSKGINKNQLKKHKKHIPKAKRHS